MQTDIDRRIAGVVESGNCAGCGACCLLDSGLQMRLGESGYVRPTRVAPSRPGTEEARFERICPGVVVTAPERVEGVRHQALGSALASWQAWASDPQVRFRGSSGGAITAVVRWLLETGEADEVVEAAKDDQQPRRSVTVRSRTPAEALEAAGSRYAPVSNAAEAVLGRPEAVFVGKPCEVAAVRALSRETGKAAPLLVSFFCAGTPSQQATEHLVDELSQGREVTDLWYRGRGWPGEFTVTTDQGVATRSYDESWGAVLGPRVQWRCKICPDGVGESADVVAADFWESDENGYPVFEEGEGVSALLARTERGLDVLTRAFAAGVLAGSDLKLDSLAGVQPLQVARHRSVLARGLGARLAGRRLPRFRGFRLLRSSPRNPREFARIARGTFGRVRAGKAQG